MLICNQLRLNFEFWRSSFARMLVGVASKIKRLSSAQVWRSSVSELPVVTASAPIERIGRGGRQRRKFLPYYALQHRFELHVVRD